MPRTAAGCRASFTRVCAGMPEIGSLEHSVRVCVCVSKETLLVVKYGQVPVSCFVFFVAEVHVAECPRRQTTLSLSLNCILCLFIFFSSASLFEDKVVFSHTAATPFVATAILAVYHGVITSNHSM